MKYMKVSLPEHNRNCSSLRTALFWEKQENSPSGFGLLCWHFISACKISSHADRTWWLQVSFPFTFFFFPLFVCCLLFGICVCVCFFGGGRWREGVPGNPQAQNTELKRSILLFLSTTLNSKSLNQHRFLAHSLPCRSGFPPAYTSARHGHLPSCSLP